MKGKFYQTPSSAHLHPLIAQKHTWKPQNTLRHPKHIPLSPRNSIGYSQALFRQSERHLSCQRKSGGTLGEMRRKWRCLLGVRNVSECLWLPLAMSRGDMGVFGDVYGCLGGVRGSWKVLGDLRGVSGSLLPSISGSHKWDSWHFPVDPRAPNVSNIKMSQNYGRFELLGSIGGGFRAEL